MAIKFNNEVLVFDVEATGLDPVKNACIEIGAVLLDKDLNMVNEFSTLVAPWPGAEIVKESMAVHKISLEELNRGPDFRTAVGEFHERYGTKKPLPILAGWNVWFDVFFVRALYDKAGIKWPFSHHFLDIQSVELFMGALKVVSLENTVKSMVVGDLQTHRAIDDARQTAKVLQVLAQRHL